MTSEAPHVKPADAIEEEVRLFQQDCSRLIEEVQKVIVGHRDIIECSFLALMAGGNVLLESVPGLGKTSFVRALSNTLGLQFSRVQFTPDLMPMDILGTSMIVEDEANGKHLTFEPGPIFTNVLLADEINRATPKTQSAMLEAMQERTVTVGKKTYRLDEPFFVLATQNPLEMEGTYPLPEAQLDRFIFKLNMSFPTLNELHDIVDRTTCLQEPVAHSVVTQERLLEMKRLARQVPVARHVQDYALRLLQATHPDSRTPSSSSMRRYLRFGASPRGAQAILTTAKVRALMHGRYNASIEDIRVCARYALRHRIILSFEAEAEGINPDEILAEIIEQTPQVLKS